MINVTDTSFTDTKDSDFVATGQMLVWRHNGQTQFSLLYRPTDAALAWDRPRIYGQEAFAIGSRFGGFHYVTIKVTGRKLTKATGSDLYGMRSQVTWNIGPDSLEEDRSQAGAWVV